MAYEFKKISDVEVMTEVPGDATVLGVSGGQVVQMPSNGLGGNDNSGEIAVVKFIIDTSQYDDEHETDLVTCNLPLEKVCELFHTTPLLVYFTEIYDEEPRYWQIVTRMNVFETRWGSYLYEFHKPDEGWMIRIVKNPDDCFVQNYYDDGE